MSNREEEGFYNNYSSDILYRNKRNAKKVEKVLKYGSRCELVATDKIAEDLEDTARRHNSKYCTEMLID